jgi:hypothetical protein
MADRSRNGRLRKLGPLSFAYNALGGAEQLRGSALHKLRTKGRAALVRAL